MAPRGAIRGRRLFGRADFCLKVGIKLQNIVIVWIVLRDVAQMKELFVKCAMWIECESLSPVWGAIRVGDVVKKTPLGGAYSREGGGIQGGRGRGA